MKIFESVPNISEGRDLAKIKIFADLLRAIPELKLLNYSADQDHNRSVFTYIGSRAAIIQAGYELTKKASEILDLREHQGVHPRLGVVDVLPIIPVWGSEMNEAVEIAHILGRKIEKELKIPAYFYEFAAREPKNTNLADLRRSGYNREGLKVHSSAGAVCIGARDFLVAYNVNLNSDDLPAAKEIARQMRERNSGFHGVKALGLRLYSQGCVQVSMNLTKPAATSLEEIYSRVAELAKGAGMSVKTEQLIGVLPLQVIREAQKLSDDLDQKIEMLKPHIKTDKTNEREGNPPLPCKPLH